MSTFVSVLRTTALLSAFSGVLLLVPAEAAVGDRYLSATLDRLDLDDGDLRDARGSTVALNLPLSQQMDLSAEYAYLYTRDRETRDRLAGHEIFFNSTYAWGSDGVRPYLRGGLGWARATGAGPHTQDWLYDAEVGLECPAGQMVRLTPYLNYTDGFRRRVEGAFEYGVRSELKLARTVSLLGSVSRNNDEEWGFKAGLLVRF